jgi:hypothetical protein
MDRPRTSTIVADALALAIWTAAVLEGYALETI